MKKVYTLVFTLFLLLSNGMLNAQNDTLFFLNFQTDPSGDMELFPDPGFSDDSWVNWDEDGKDAASSFPSNWFYDYDWGQVDSIGPADTNFVFLSRSWLADFDTISSNWLISPAMDIVDDKATLHWKSAPFQGPRYIDGYTVKILVGSQDYTSAEVTTVYVAAEMTDFIGDGQNVDIANFTFSGGYVHADSYTDTTYFIPAGAGETTHDGLLEPHSVSLAEFSGKTIFVAFHHDSADDNLLEIDDFLLLGTDGPFSSASEEVADLRFVTYPNPADNFLNVMFRLDTPADIRMELMSQDGKLVAAKPARFEAVGEFNEQFDLRRLPAGVYTVVLTVNNKPVSKQILKK